MLTHGKIPPAKPFFRLGRRTHIDKYDVDADLFNTFQIDKLFRFGPAEALPSRHNDPLDLPLGIGKNDVTDAT